jgi:hypothetical protein
MGVGEKKRKKNLGNGNFSHMSLSLMRVSIVDLVLNG